MGCIKHTHHAVEAAKPGKDSHALRAAGAQQLLLASPSGWALMVDTPQGGTDDFTRLVGHLDLNTLDLVLVEGFKFEDFPKLALHREDLSGACLPPQDDTVIAIASNQQPLPQFTVPVFALDDGVEIARFIIHHCPSQRGLRDTYRRT